MRIVTLCRGEHACVSESGWVSGGLCYDLSSMAELAMVWTLEAVGSTTESVFQHPQQEDTSASLWT
jgi:hypothetical protein